MDRAKLEQIRHERKPIINFRKNLEPKCLSDCRYEIMVCSSTGCRASGSMSIHDLFVNELAKNNITDVKVNNAGCLGLCAMGPVVIVYPEATFYTKVKDSDVGRIVNEHIMNNRPVEDLIYKDEDGRFCYDKHSVPFYKEQQFIARLNSEYMNPESIEDYIALDGYFALNKCISSMTPEDVILEIKRSGLRGRGGAGFSTGTKWELTRASAGADKFVICNADEGDPGAFMDRSIIEANPHAIIEAMAIAGYAIGANNGIIYIRAEYPLAGQRIAKAIQDAKEMGLLGNNIFGSSFSFDINIKLGAGAFVCGEETALIQSCEGSRGEPVSKPPYPASCGYLGKPTSINNVETFANIPHIINNGAEWFSRIGTETSKGTKVFALSGKVNHTGLVELAMGTTIRDIIYNIGGGIPNGKKFKAVQMGGPSGGCITEKDLDTPIDYENLKSLGSMMGSGGMIVMDEDTCMVDIAKYFLEFSVDESCGKCTPCRIGNKRLLELLQKICNGDGEMQDLTELEELAKYVKDNSLCGLGQCSPNPVLSTLRYFKDEYVEHIRDKKCKAGVCKNLVKYEINKNKCVGCSACSRKCPVDCIHGEIKSPYVIDQSRCVKCGTCYATCRFGAIERK